MAGGAEGTGIGGRVRAARERAGLSREALAVRSGISWSAIAQVETGRRTNLRPLTLSALADALGVTIDYLVNGRSPARAMLEHHALVYEDENEFLSAASTFLAPGLERSEAALAITSSDKIDALRDRLGDGAEGVTFADHRHWYTGPGDALRRIREFVDAALADGAPWVRVVGEPVWDGRSHAEVRQWSRYESLLNLVFSGAPVTVLCAYAKDRLDAKIIEQAYATHRHTLEHAALSPSPGYIDPGAYALEP